MLERKAWATIGALPRDELVALVLLAVSSLGEPDGVDADRLVALGHCLAAKGRGEADEALVAWCEADATPRRLDAAAMVLSTRWAEVEGSRQPDGALVVRFAAMVRDDLPASTLADVATVLRVARR